MDALKLPQKFRPIELVGVASGSGAMDMRCGDGADALREAQLAAYVRSGKLQVRWTTTIRPPLRNLADRLKAVQGVCERLALGVDTIVRRGDMPVVLGGDHACAIGTWKGVANAMRAHGPLGLLWIDAHLDAHTPATTESGMLHGMPVACLLGEGYPELVGIADAIRLDPDNVCLFGVRSFEAAEADLVGRLGVRVYFMDEIRRRGLRTTLHEAIDRVTVESAAFGISLDLDAICPDDAPAVGTPAAGGFLAAELFEALAERGRDARLVAVEIVEYNPFLDRHLATAGLIGDALNAILLGQATFGVVPVEVSGAGSHRTRSMQCW